MMADRELRRRLDRIQTRRALSSAAPGWRLSWPAWFIWPAHFFPAYLVGYPLLGRDRPGLPRTDDAAPPGRRLVGAA